MHHRSSPFTTPPSTMPSPLSNSLAKGHGSQKQSSPVLSKSSLFTLTSGVSSASASVVHITSPLG